MRSEAREMVEEYVTSTGLEEVYPEAAHALRAVVNLADIADWEQPRSNPLSQAIRATVITTLEEEK